MFILKMIKMDKKVEHFKCKTILGAKRFATTLYKSDISYFAIVDIRDGDNNVVASFNYWTNNGTAKWLGEIKASLDGFLKTHVYPSFSGRLTIKNN